MKKLFEKIKKKPLFSSAEEKQIAREGSLTERLQLAKSENTSPEILYYLAEHDEDKKVRQAVVQNMASPIHASPILARDKDIGVRELLLARLTKLLPNISPETQSQVYNHVSEALGTLALDEVLKVRIALSAALKNYAHTPPKVANQLARDLEREVSEPVLRYSLALSDDDLIDILKNFKQSWQVQAVALRESLSESVSQAVIETDDVEAGALLLSNVGAAISPKTYKDIVTRAKDQPTWHKHLAMRKNLPVEVACEMAEYIDNSIKELLFRHQEFDKETIEEISNAVACGVHILENQDSNISINERIKQHKKDGTLTDKTIQTAMGVGDTEFVKAALSEMANVPAGIVKKTLELQAAKPLTALCWKAGLSMRTTLILQRELAKIPQKELLHPKGGTDYPLKEGELRWQLEFLGIE